MRIHLITAEPDPQDVVRALEFQYQQKIQALQLENAKLQNELAQSKLCAKEPGFPDPRPLPQPPPGSPLDTNTQGSHETVSREQKVFREALRDVQHENWNEAIVSMETFVKNFPKSDLADHALFWIAQIYIQKNEIDLARTELERLIKMYPKGSRVKRAKAKLRELRKISPTQRFADDLHQQNSKPLTSLGATP